MTDCTRGDDRLYKGRRQTVQGETTDCTRGDDRLYKGRRQTVQGETTDCTRGDDRLYKGRRQTVQGETTDCTRGDEKLYKGRRQTVQEEMTDCTRGDDRLYKGRRQTVDPGTVSLFQCGRELVDVHQSTVKEASVTSYFHLQAESGTFWLYNSGLYMAEVFVVKWYPCRNYSAML